MPTARSAALPLAALLGLAAVPAALAGTYVTTTADKPFNTDPTTSITYLNQGFYYSYGFHEPFNNNHTTGGNTSGDVPGGVGTSDKRSFYTFDLSGLNLTGQVVTGATLTLVPFQENGTVVEAGQSTSGRLTQTLALFDVTTPAATLNSRTTDTSIFADLGNGASYGSFAVPLAPTTDTSLTLDPAALAGITAGAGGFFSVGGVVESLPSDPARNESLFGFSADGQGRGVAQELTITTAPRAAAVPEASQMSYLALGGLCLGGLIRRRARRAAA